MKGRNLYGNWHRSREYRLVRARLAVLQRCSAVRNQRNGSNRNCANVQERGTSPEPILPKPCHPKPIETGLCHVFVLYDEGQQRRSLRILRNR